MTKAAIEITTMDVEMYTARAHAERAKAVHAMFAAIAAFFLKERTIGGQNANGKLA
jgi:hypothetical protein